jgi:DNA polymerase III alpha subunit (gram-positive type)
MSFLKAYPGADELLKSYDPEHSGFPLKVNNHIHTPFSFSAFSSIEEAVKMAASEDVRILGINDFYVTDGYPDFIEMCRKHGVFPLLNIELIGISKVEQEAGIRVNDPGNPGRTYISGK